MQPANHERPLTAPEILESYQRLPMLSEEERQNELRYLIFSEFSLEHADLRGLVNNRLRGWLKLAPDDAEKMGASYQAVMDQAPAGVAMSYVAIMQSLIGEFTPNQQLRLRALIPVQVLGLAPQVFHEARPPAPGEPWWSRLRDAFKKPADQGRRKSASYPPG
jgi:hypothetical protein